jgi:hypothetical protein
MKPMTLTTIIGSCLAAACLLASASLQAGVAVLELERSTNSTTWEKVALDPTLLTTTGGVLQNMNEPHALYRLKISDDRNAGFVTALPLNRAPVQTVAIARQFLEDLLIEDAESEGGDPEGTWSDAYLGPVCYPIYDPGVDGGRAPAYIEFKVLRTAQFPAGPTPNDPFGMSPPDMLDNNCDFGYLLVALTTNDVPVPGFAQSGATPVEMLLRKARTSGPVKPVRYDDGLLIGEDAAGDIVASIGNVPFFLDPSILTIAGREFEGFENEQGSQDDGAPSFPARGYASYQEFKTDFATNALYVELRRLRARSAAQDWNAVLGIEPEIIRVPVGVRTTVLENRQIQAAQVEDPAVAIVNVPSSGNGLWVTGQQDGGTLLEVTFAGGATETFVLLVGTGAGNGGPGAATAGWTAWKYWYAGSWSDQRHYTQFGNDPQMCPNGASGCGPAAWAMLYGWWDRKGSPRLMKNTSQADAPLQNDDSVRDCNRYVFNQVGPFCVNGQAATMPWNMKAGRHWASHRNAGRDITWKWGVPYLSPGSVTKAADSIKSGRPSIIGLGFYWHYPLAYGYKGRQYKTGSVVWSTQRYFKCNMGWGGGPPQWRNADSTWFGTHARYW